MFSLTGPYIWDVASALFALISIGLINAAFFDRRRLSGENTWLKPLRFAVSLTIHFMTFALISAYLPVAHQNSAWIELTAITSVAAGLFAIGYMAVQAGRLRHSHFNTSTPLEAALLGLLGISAFLVLAPPIVLGWDVAIHTLEGWSLAVRLGVATGLLGGAALTAATGLRMGAAGSRFAVAGRRGQRPMAMTGWSLGASDLRPAHFLANHMTQATPLAGLCASALLPRVAAIALTAAFSASWFILTLFALRAAASQRRLKGSGHREPPSAHHDDISPDFELSISPSGLIIP